MVVACFMISDPDVESDSASDTNQLGATFNVVFNEDYLYDTIANDENFTYFFQGDYSRPGRRPWPAATSPSMAGAASAGPSSRKCAAPTPP